MSSKNKEPLNDIFRIVVIGDNSVGKTAILDKYCNSKFSFAKKKQKSLEQFKKTVEYKGKEYCLKLWDINYNEKNEKPELYQKADCIIIVCSINDRQSFEHIENWLNILSDIISDITSKLYFIIANKIDLEEERLINTEEIKQKADKYQMDFFEVSAMDSSGIDEAFEKIVEKLVNNIYKNGGKKGNTETSDDMAKSQCIIF